MFEACVQMSLLPQTADLFEVRMVYVCIHPEQSFVYCVNHFHEIWREWFTKLGWKYCVIIYLLMQQTSERG